MRTDGLSSNISVIFVPFSGFFANNLNISLCLAVNSNFSITFLLPMELANLKVTKNPAVRSANCGAGSPSFLQ